MKFCQISNVFFSRQFLQLQKIKFQPLKNLIVAKYHKIPIQNQKKILYHLKCCILITAIFSLSQKTSSYAMSAHYIFQNE